MENIPVYDGDLFDAASLRNPFGHYRRIRNLGPVVWLSMLQMPVLARFADVQAALRAPGALISGEGIGFNEEANVQPPTRGVLTSDGARHRRLRKVTIRPLMPAQLKQHRQAMKDLVRGQIRRLNDHREFEAVDQLARFLPLNAVTELVGLADTDRAKMLDWAAAFFNFLGPYREGRPGLPDMTRDRQLRAEVQEFFAKVDPATFRPGSWSAELYETCSSGELNEVEFRGALRAFVVPSLDTTILTKSVLLHVLATQPGEWRKLKDNPTLVPSAALEAVRYASVARAFSRFAAQDYKVGEVHIPAGQRVMILFGSANRDERHYDDPETFDAARNPVDHLGWGTGPHMCAGMHLAKMEIEVMLEALLEEVDEMEAGEPTWSLNQALYGVEKLPMQFSPR